jgi:hypothetical protein
MGVLQNSSQCIFILLAIATVVTSQTCCSAVGYYNTAIATQPCNCARCTRGWYCPFGSSLRTQCERGHYQPLTGQKECRACPMNTRCALPGMHYFIVCPNNAKSMPGSESCDNGCREGFFLHDMVCKPLTVCTANEFQDANTQADRAGTPD